MSSQSVILVTGADLAAQAVALLKDYRLVYAGKTPKVADLVALAKLHNPVAVIVRYSSITPEVMDAAPALQVISKHGSGTDTIDLVAAAARGIAVKAAVGANAVAVAEHALALLLACAKSVVTLNERMHAGHWDKSSHQSMELAGRTVGLIGLGAIGQRFASMCGAMDMRVIGFDPFAKGLPAYIEAVDLDTLWRESDAISLHCPLTPDNRLLVNARTLAQCKKGVLLINTARGGLIDEPALLAAVQTGQVRKAALDSFSIEPMVVPHIFQHQPGIILSPHIGGVTSDAYVNMGVAAAQNILHALQTRHSKTV